MKNKLVIALTVFTIVFCSPAIVASALETYMDFGGKLGMWIYDTTHEDIKL